MMNSSAPPLTIRSTKARVLEFQLTRSFKAAESVYTHIHSFAHVYLGFQKSRYPDEFQHEIYSVGEMTVKP